MTKALDLPQSPYKFLDYYKRKDRPIFFGRKGETRILLSDVVVARLVVLFAKTGTGKTSIINAGVRPILQDRGYATFFIRVKKDPVESARKTIIEPDDKEESATIGDNLSWRGATFAERLENVARDLGKPIVLFFDQFEEFFIYPLEEGGTATEEGRQERQRRRAEQLAKKREFVADIAAIYHNPQSRVHIVFSMREEWFVEMDIFRDEIPKIFHNDSNLRLRWFDESQAREAIKLPAKAFGVDIADEVVDKLIKDLCGSSANREIEPAQLQIVCDTLWRNTEGERITLADYEELGERSPGPGGSEGDADPERQSVAERILFRRLEEEFEKIKDEEQLCLLYAILPKLRTEWRTKYVHEIVSLNKLLARDEDHALREIMTDEVALQRLLGKLRDGEQLLRDTLQRLKDDTGLIRYPKGLSGKQEFVELSHDYLVGSLGALQDRVKGIVPMRLLNGAMNRYEKSGGKELASFEELEKISRASAVLSLNREQSKLMLRSALFFGSYMRLWFERVTKDPPADKKAAARPGGEEVWEILRERIADIDDTSNVIDLLAELQTRETFELLKSTLPDEEIASHAIGVFGRKEMLPVVELLGEALRHKALARQARAALERLSKSERHKEVAERARGVLKEYQEKGAETRAAEESPAFVVVGGDPVFRPARREAGEGATADLDFSDEPLETPKSLEPHYRTVLKAFADGRVVPFLGAAVNMASRPAEAAWEPGQFLPTGRELASHLAEAFGYPAPNGRLSPDLAQISQYVAVTAGKGALYDELHQLFARPYQPTPLHRFFARLPAIMGAKGYAGRGQVILTTNYDDVLERAFRDKDGGGVPFDLLSYVADGEHRGKFLHHPFDGEPRPIEAPNEYRGLAPDQRTVIIKISGGVHSADAERDSFVITEDDYIDQLALSDIASLIPVTLAARLRRSHFLFLGYGLRDWNVRVILRRIWGEQRRAYKSWAIQFNPSRFDQELWLRRGVDILNVPLERYVSELEEHVQQYNPQ